MNSHSDVAVTIADLDKYLNDIFDCQQKIKSLTSELRALNAERALIDSLIRAQNLNLELTYVH